MNLAICEAWTARPSAPPVGPERRDERLAQGDRAPPAATRTAPGSPSPTARRARAPCRRAGRGTRPSGSSPAVGPGSRRGCRWWSGSAHRTHSGQLDSCWTIIQKATGATSRRTIVITFAGVRIAEGPNDGARWACGDRSASAGSVPLVDDPADGHGVQVRALGADDAHPVELAHRQLVGDQDHAVDLGRLAVRPGDAHLVDQDQAPRCRSARRDAPALIGSDSSRSSARRSSTSVGGDHAVEVGGVGAVLRASTRRSRTSRAARPRRSAAARRGPPRSPPGSRR